MSALMGIFTARAIAATTPTTSANESTWPSGRPCAQATPELVVAIASAPQLSARRALPVSHAFGRTRIRHFA